MKWCDARKVQPDHLNPVIIIMVDGDERQAYFSKIKSKWIDAESFNGLSTRSVMFWRETTKQKQPVKEKEIDGQMSLDDFLTDMDCGLE